MTSRARVAVLFSGLGLAGACSDVPAPRDVPPSASSAPSPSLPSASSSALPLASSSAVPVASSSPPVAIDEACPKGMVHVVADRCPELVRKCVLAPEKTKDNRHICTRFAKEKRCDSPEREHMDFCIDKFEYPNREGEHAHGLASWYDAQTTCHALGKRLCWEAEWVTACEGPDELPFPGGLERDPEACNIDLPAQMALLDRLLSKNAKKAEKEYRRLDRSRASGSMKGCVSGFGVADLTGNFDEWVNGESYAGPGGWGALLGGSWIRSRNQCRGRMSEHGPKFRFHALSFRCCADAKGRPPRAPSGGAKPPSVPASIDPRTWPGIDLATRPF